MFYLVLVILFTGLFSYLFTLIPVSLWFLFAWIPLSFILAVLVVTLLTLLFLFLCPKKVHDTKIKRFAFMNAAQLCLMFMNFRIKSVGRENIPNDTFVVYSNHKCNMDPIFLMYDIKKPCGAVAKSTLFTNKIMNNVKDLVGLYSLDRNNDREGVKAIVEAIKDVKKGRNVIIFPEGGIKTRETEKMTGLKPGAYKLATKPQAMILPVTIIGSSKVINSRFFQRKNIKIVYHKPITKEEYAGMNTTEIGEMVQKIIDDGLTM